MTQNISFYKILFFVCFLIVGKGLLAQTTGLYKTIQLGTFSFYNETDFDAVRHLGYVYTEPVDGTKIRVLLGGYADETKAIQTLQQVKSNGFADAFLSTKNLTQGAVVSAIQLATFRHDANIPWARFLNVGDIYLIPAGVNIKLVTGKYTDEVQARRQLARVREMGFSGAFIKKINSQLLRWVTPVDTGGLEQQAVTVIRMVPSEYAAASGYTQAAKTTAAPREFSARGIPQATKSASLTEIPKAGNTSVLVAIKTNRKPTVYTPPTSTPAPSTTLPPMVEKSPTPSSNNNFVRRSAAPKVHITSKRTSAKWLQELLQKQETYTSGVDGQYGPATYTAYQNTLEKNPQLRKYILLVQASSPAYLGDCRDWEAIRLVMRVAQDIDFSSFSGENERYLKTLYHHPEALDENERQLIVSWDYRFRRGLKNWASSDPLRAEVADALKIAYLQSQVQLEDHFASKGHSKTQAKSLALSALKYLVGDNLERFQAF